MAQETAVAGSGLGADAVELLCELIRLDTVNPPGNEGPAQEILAARLGDAGFDCTLLAADPDHPNLIARLPGETPGETLCLLGHVDTVPADPGEWSFDPWSGEVVDGEVLGRGAQDMKGQVAAEVAAAVDLARAGWRPERGELKLVVTADEEMGGGAGARWLCSEHPEVVRADLVVNEGGGAAFELGGKRFYPLCVGEKGVCRLRLRARGKAGHGSVPALGDNALLKLAAVLTRFSDQPQPEPTPEGISFLSVLLGRDLSAAEVEPALAELRGLSPALVAYLAEPMLRVTLAPTTARAGEKDNVIPSHAEALIDCRVPPGIGPDTVLAQVGELLGPLAETVEIEPGDPVVGNRSPVSTPLSAAIRASLAELDPEATLIPIVMPGFSDSHWFRRAFDSATVYGFFPQRALGLFEAAPLIHSADERAAVADIELAASFYADLCRRVLG
jgi:acetylornithine deacetylase/succinyl-diaminopimelate desuccinylase-like protein